MAGIAAAEISLERMVWDRMRVGRTVFGMVDMAVDARNALLLMDGVGEVHADVFVAGDAQLGSVIVLCGAIHILADFE